MSVIAEALEHLQLLTFFNQAELDRYKTLFDASTEMQPLFEANVGKM